MNREDKRAAEREARRLERQEAAGGAGVGPVGGGGGGAATTAKKERTSPVQFLKEVRTELRKVAWPHRKEVVNYTVVVLVVTTFLTTIIFGMDWVIRNATLNLFG